MPRFVIEPHFRLQEWVAEEKGYFAQEGLDYVFRELVQANAGSEALKKLARAQGVKTLRESGLDLVLQGLTTVEEVFRHTVE